MFQNIGVILCTNFLSMLWMLRSHFGLLRNLRDIFFKLIYTKKKTNKIVEKQVNNLKYKYQQNSICEVGMFNDTTTWTFHIQVIFKLKYVKITRKTTNVVKYYSRF
ncbi:hypothetical protein ACKWTF_000374 [Chironomus riparius]